MEALLFSPLHRQRHRCSCTAPKREHTDGDTQEEERVFQKMKINAMTTGNSLSFPGTLIVELLPRTTKHFIYSFIYFCRSSSWAWNSAACRGTHALPGRHSGTVVQQDVGEDGEEHLEALVRFVASAELNAEEDEQGGGSCLLLGATCRQDKETIQ